MTLTLRILRSLTRQIIILLSLPRSLFSEKMLISNVSISGLMSNLIKKSQKVSILYFINSIKRFQIYTPGKAMHKTSEAFNSQDTNFIIFSSRVYSFLLNYFDRLFAALYSHCTGPRWPASERSPTALVNRVTRQTLLI